MADSDSEGSFESADEGEMKGGKETATGETKRRIDDSRDGKTISKKEDSTRTIENVADSESIEDKSSAGDCKTSDTQKPDKMRKESDIISDSSAQTEESSSEVGRTLQDESRGGSGDSKSKSLKENKTEDNQKEIDNGKGTIEERTSKTKVEDENERKIDEEDEKSEPVGEEIRDRGSTSATEENSTAGAATDSAPSSESGASSWGWGGWGSSLLSSAAATVTKVSDNVGKGLTSVLENVESSLGVPKPEELSELEKQEEAKQAQKLEDDKGKPEVGESKEEEEETEEEKMKEQEEGGAGFGGFFTLGASALTNVMEKTVSSGLDALEAIGRKTMDILQEGDPRLEKTRAFIAPKREINLSEVLRQAKEEAEEEAKRKQEEEELQKYNYGFLFDQYQGLVHLEALEMLSNQSETKVQTSIAMVTEEDLEEVKTELLEIRDAFHMEDVDSVEEDSTNEQDFVNVVTELLFSLSVAATPDKLQRSQKEAKDWLSSHHATKSTSSEEEDCDEELQVKNVHARALQTLAELTSRTIEQFHKTAELMLLDEEKAEDRNQMKCPVESATTLSKLASILTAEISSVATRFCELLTSLDQQNQSEEVSSVITNIYLEASNSSSYIQDAFQLLLPVMQDIAVTRRNAVTT